METGNIVMSSNVVMLAILALLVVAGLAISLIAIALATIRSVDGQAPQQPADISKAQRLKEQLKEQLAQQTGQQTGQQTELPRQRTGSSRDSERLSH
ncbi:hypothetical protein [Streptosporangium carneum]|uniref:Uncharacterized protein n=1 Tax=Streptosporangium carneum TaxID=47481 RepID=A0A9W6MF08_9ACTN|nr:hypothetical protein [Streptosporangium carneum]GLK11682.1 hypothetical protein GCM10017600_50890 [Streptosporangium carneum]